MKTKTLDYKATIKNKNNFLNIVENYPKSLNESNIIISQIPYEMTTSYIQGTKNGAKSIIKNSAYVELFDERYNLELDKLGIATLKELSLSKVTKEKDKLELIYKHALDILSYKKFPIFIGGEHTITAPIVKAFLEKQSKNFAVISFDAHSDLRDTYENNINSHACVMRRIHQDLGIQLAEIGVRAQCKEEYDYIKDSNIDVLYAHQIDENSNSSITKILKKLPKNIYISFDFDALDPSTMMATGTIEPNGLSYKEAITFIETISKHSNIIGMDFVEHCPSVDERYSYIAAKFIASCIAVLRTLKGWLPLK